VLGAGVGEFVADESLVDRQDGERVDLNSMFRTDRI
jgi:hypothetical protein